MSKIFILIIVLFLFNNCSLNENSKIWKNKNKNENKIFENSDNIKRLFVEEKVISTEFNPELTINIPKINATNKITSNRNDYGSQNYNGLLKKELSYSFSKLDNINQLNFKPAFLLDGLIFLIKKVLSLDTIMIKK